VPPSDRSADRSDYIGCGLWALGFLVLVIVSFVVGSFLRPDDDEGGGNVDEVTLAEGGRGDSAYELKGGVDETGDPCVSLQIDGEEVTGQCGFAVGTGDEADRYVVTSTLLDDGTTVVFAPLPRAAESVRLDMADGSTPEVDARESTTAGVVWFVYESDSEVAGPATVLDADGEPLIPE
jgi:hypothetical protein